MFGVIQPSKFETGLRDGGSETDFDNIVQIFIAKLYGQERSRSACSTLL